MGRVVIDSLLSYLHFRGRLIALACVQVSRVSRKVTRRNFNSDPVPLLEKIGRGPKIDLILVGLARLQQRRLFERFAIPGAKDVLDQALRVAVGMYIDQLCCPIRIRRRRGRPKLDFNRSGLLSTGRWSSVVPNGLAPGR
jgi:hypothetical protein